METKPRSSRRAKGKVKTALVRGRVRSVESSSYDPPVPKVPKVATVAQMVEHMLSDPTVQIDATVLGVKRLSSGIKKLETKRITNRETFLSLFKECNTTFRESDPFSDDSYGTSGGLIGNDFIPLLGGPFNKQLYLNDMLQQQALAFHAYHHDPIAFRSIQILRDFTLGKGWGTKCKSDKHHAVWQAFEKVNKLQELFDYSSIELSIYGENMHYWLPDNATKIEYKVSSAQESPRALLPRIRLFDPSMIWEIVTYPEDITRVLYYQVVSPTQYQIYTGSSGGESVPSMKYIFKQIPADDMMHTKVNVVSNEKRGRSDLYPIFGDLKRLRDTVDYAITGVQKSAAWSIDTTIDGNDEDIAAYQADQESQGTFAPAGSEFIHTSKIKREYLSNSALGKGAGNTAFDMTFAKIFIGMGIPEHYFGIQKTGGGSRAGAIVASEPVAKVFEKRQQIYTRQLTEMKTRLFAYMEMEDVDIEFTFPEIITQDRSLKLKDLALAEVQNWISNETAATAAAKELGIDTYVYETELAQIKAEDQELRAPLSPQTPQTQAPASSGPVGGQPKTQPNPQTAQAPLSHPGLLKPDAKPKTTFDGEDKAKVRANSGY